MPLIGITGAALASTISYTLACCMAILFYQRESHVPLKEMIPRSKDVMYVLNSLISMTRQVIILGNAKLKSIGLMGIRKRQV